MTHTVILIHAHGHNLSLSLSLSLSPPYKVIILWRLLNIPWDFYLCGMCRISIGKVLLFHTQEPRRSFASSSLDDGPLARSISDSLSVGFCDVQTFWFAVVVWFGFVRNSWESIRQKLLRIDQTKSVGNRSYKTTGNRSDKHTELQIYTSDESTAPHQKKGLLEISVGSIRSKTWWWDREFR
jgi:hypothetical protein